MSDDGHHLPLLTLRHGPWRAEVADPRADPHALGARYVHGGYVAGFWHGDRRLGLRPIAAWNPYVGEGLPEVFELPLGFAACEMGEEFLRLGAGRLRRTGREAGADGLLSTTVAWELAESGDRQQVWRCADAVMIGGKRFGYRLERRLRLDDDGLASTTRLHLDCPWSQPLAWFAHPFIAQADGAGTGLDLAGGEPQKNLQRGADGLWRCPAAGGFTPVTGLWGRRAILALHLDHRQGGGRLDLDLDKPLDKAVVYATPLAMSVEPYWCRAWQDGEAAEWTLRYRFTP